MDLNHSYSEHQIALIRAGSATSSRSRDKHLSAAKLIGDRIRHYQLAKGASASSGWLGSSPTANFLSEISA